MDLTLVQYWILHIIDSKSFQLRDTYNHTNGNDCNLSSFYCVMLKIRRKAIIICNFYLISNTYWK